LSEGGKMGKQQSFSEAHPILNTILAIIIFLGFVFICIMFLKWLITVIGNGLIDAGIWLKTLTSSLDAVIIVALITGSVSVVGVIFTSVVAKIVEYHQKRMEYLYRKREKPYYDFIEMVYKIQQQEKLGEKYSEKEIEHDMNKFSQQLTLWGSNKVIQKFIKFRKSASSNENNTDILFASEDLMYAMRSDMGLPKMKKGFLLSININDIENIVNKKSN
jgi:hypothetical protein